jgi:hypothetical protein
MSGYGFARPSTPLGNIFPRPDFNTSLYFQNLHVDPGQQTTRWLACQNMSSFGCYNQIRIQDGGFVPTDPRRRVGANISGGGDEYYFCCSKECCNRAEAMAEAEYDQTVRQIVYQFGQNNPAAERAMDATDRQLDNVYDMHDECEEKRYRLNAEIMG